MIINDTHSVFSAIKRFSQHEMHKSFTPVNLVDKSAILVEKNIKSAWITLAIVANSPVALTRLQGAES